MIRLARLLSHIAPVPDVATRCPVWSWSRLVAPVPIPEADRTTCCVAPAARMFADAPPDALRMAPADVRFTSPLPDAIWPSDRSPLTSVSVILPPAVAETLPVPLCEESIDRPMVLLELVPAFRSMVLPATLVLPSPRPSVIEPALVRVTLPKREVTVPIGRLALDVNVRLTGAAAVLPASALSNGLEPGRGVPIETT